MLGWSMEERWVRRGVRLNRTLLTADRPILTAWVCSLRRRIYIFLRFTEACSYSIDNSQMKTRPRVPRVRTVLRIYTRGGRHTSRT